MRAAIFAAMCVGLSAAGHIWMSGDVIPLWAVVFAFAALTASGYVLARRQFGFLSISALMLLGELAQHFLFTAAQSPALMASTSVPALPTFVSGRVVPTSAWFCGMPAHSAMSRGGVGMVAAHAGAGLLCAWWLRCGDAALFQMLRVRAALAAPLLLLPDWPATLAVPDFLRTPPTSVFDDAHLLGRYNRLFSTVVARRGPPCPRIRIV
ncbi:hypothetical protein [Actinospica sp.]|uniref:hypothetical protein n=1 Tax=Actinospica sp. TaxID=1872142 RepID=UPI002C4320F2|nr:hypothetical protein [Actinospica sp.]HWG23903.1 hypothetical protein [Actinospica sp.]